MPRKILIPKHALGGNFGNTAFGKSKFGSFLGDKGSQIGSFTSGLGNMFKGSSELTSTVNQGFHKAMQAMGPMGMAASAITGTVDMIGGALGAKIDAIDNDAAAAAGVSAANTANQLIGGIPLVGTVGGIFAGKTIKGNKSAETSALADAFGGSNALIDKAVKMGGKKMLFGRRKANRFIREQNRKNKLITGIGIENQLSSMNSIGDSIAAQNQNLYSGYSPQLMLAKHGAKLEKLDEARNILNTIRLNKIKSVQNEKVNKETNELPIIKDVKREEFLFILSKEDNRKLLELFNSNKEIEAGKFITNLIIEPIIEIDLEVIDKLNKIYENAEIEAGELFSDTYNKIKQIYEKVELETGIIFSEYINQPIQNLEKFKSGGILKNIIVEGALHARKHHLEDKHPELKDNITHKGIPVISKNGDEIIQHAEIERGELILTKEVTEQVESFYKDGSEQAMIDAGKLLARSLIKNTIDKTKEIL